LEEDEETKERKRWEEEDEKIVRQVFSKVDATTSNGESGKVTLKRKADGEAPDVTSLLSESTKAMVDSAKGAVAPPAKKARTTLANSLGIKPARRKPAVH